MAGLTDDGVHLMLDAALGSGHSASWPATVWIGLLIGASEVTGNGYSRIGVANNTATWPAAAGRTKKLATTVTFDVATGNWGSITHFLLSTAISGGTTLLTQALPAPVTIAAGDTAEIPINMVTLHIN